MSHDPSALPELSPEDEAFVGALQRDFAPPPAPLGADAALARALAEGLAARKRRRLVFRLAPPLALAAAGLAWLVLLGPASGPGPASERAPIAAETSRAGEVAVVLALLAEPEAHDDELYPEDYLALADALAWD